MFDYEVPLPDVLVKSVGLTVDAELHQQSLINSYTNVTGYVEQTSNCGLQTADLAAVSQTGPRRTGLKVNRFMHYFFLRQ